MSHWRIDATDPSDVQVFRDRRIFAYADDIDDAEYMIRASGRYHRDDMVELIDDEGVEVLRW